MKWVALSLVVIAVAFACAVRTLASDTAVCFACDAIPCTYVERDCPPSCSYCDGKCQP